MKSSEKQNVKFRRSLYIVEDVKKGEKFTYKNVKSIRPGYGVAPKYLKYIVGKTASIDISSGTPFHLDLSR